MKFKTPGMVTLAAALAFLIFACDNRTTHSEGSPSAVSSIPSLPPSSDTPDAPPVQSSGQPTGEAPPLNPPVQSGAISMFNGKDLSGWKSVNFGGEGEVLVENGQIQLGMGESMTAIVYDGTDPLPTVNYEISLEANKLLGNDFLCGLTFPVRDDHATLIVGGWGGSVVGISSIDDFDASENETAQFMAFETGRWYKIRLRVEEERIVAWIEDTKVIDVSIAGRRVSMRPGEIELCVPLGIASYETRSALRRIEIASF